MLVALRQTVLRRRRAEFTRRSQLYYTNDTATATAYQLRRVNEVWAEALATQPFYQRWRRQHGLPPAILSLEQFAEFPTVGKNEINEARDLVFANTDLARTYSTSGSTGVPTLLPRGGSSEADERYATAMIGRSWWGVHPGDPYVHLWGHLHAIGSGPRVAVRRILRRMQDVAVGATRLNGYDLSDNALEEQWVQLRRANPRYVVAYTSSIVRLAAHVRSRRYDASSLTRLKFILASAETVIESDKESVETAFGVPLISEYGSGELGAVAVSYGDTWPFRVFWDSVLVQLRGNEIDVTSLHPRHFPLIKYEMGDLASDCEVVSGSVLSLGRISGRASDVVRIRSRAGGEPIVLHPLLPNAIVRRNDGVTSVQVQQRGERLFVMATGEFHLDTKALREDLLRKLEQEHPGVDEDSVVLRQASRPWLSRAGKQLPVIPSDVFVPGID